MAEIEAKRDIQEFENVKDLDTGVDVDYLKAHGGTTKEVRNVGSPRAQLTSRWSSTMPSNRARLRDGANRPCICILPS